MKLQSLRDSGDKRGFLSYFRKCIFRFKRIITSWAGENNFDSAGEYNFYGFKKVMMASGTEWLCDANGTWRPFNRKNPVKDIMVRELFEYNGMNNFFSFECPLKDFVNWDALAFVFDQGCALSMEHFKKSYESERGKCDMKRCINWQECSGNTINK